MMGEELYKTYKARILSEYPTEGTVDSVNLALKTVKLDIAECSPANEKGQISYFRAIVESLCEEIEEYLKKNINPAQ